MYPYVGAHARFHRTYAPGTETDIIAKSHCLTWVEQQFVERQTTSERVIKCINHAIREFILGKFNTEILGIKQAPGRSCLGSVVELVLSGRRRVSYHRANRRFGQTLSAL